MAFKLNFAMAGRLDKAGDGSSLTPSRSDWATALLVSATLVAGYCVGINITYQVALVLLVAGAALLVVLNGAAGVRWGFVFWIVTLSIGMRTIPITPYFRLHPSELVLWGLLGWSFIWTALKRLKADFWLPWWVYLFLPFGVWGWFAGRANGQTWDVIVSDWRIFLLLIPLSLLAATVVTGPQRWRTVLATYYLVATGIAALGVLEYVFPGIRAAFPQFITDPLAQQSSDGFLRARFSFWGGAGATYSCLLAIPMAIPLWNWWRGQWARVMTVTAAFLLLAGVYLGGFRVFWLLFAMQCFVFLIVTKRYLLMPVFVLAGLAGYGMLPSTAQDRIQSLGQILIGEPTDTSGFEHLNRPKMGLESILNHPQGLGWGAAGWVHSDFIQVGVNLGLVPGVLFLAAFVRTSGKLWRRVTKPGPSSSEWALSTALLLSLLTAGGILSTQAVIVTPFLALPVWFVWVMAELRLRQTSVQDYVA